MPERWRRDEHGSARVTKWVLAAVIVGVGVGASSPAVAQSPRFEPAFGYQLLHVTDDPGTTFPFGLAADLALSGGASGFVLEAGWSKRSEGVEPDDVRFNFWHVGAGYRWTLRKHPRVWPYAQALLGGAFHDISGEVAGTDQSDTTNHWMVQPGGGVTVRLGTGLGIFGALDYRRVFLNEDEEGDSRLNEIRVFVGVRLGVR